jgi:uncharacterized membrane protein YdjX (TVP38/TMEM64 family)
MQMIKRFKSSIKFLVLIAVLVLSWLLGRYYSFDTDRFNELLLRFPLFWSGLIFVFLYVAVTFFAWFSKDLFKVLGAVLFGAYLSSFLIWIAEIFNATILFHLSYFLGRDFVERSLKGRMKRFDQKLASAGFGGIFLLRIVPLVPFRFLDVAVGLTKVRFRQYLLAVIFGSPLRIFWIQYILAGVGKAFFKDPGVLIEYFSANRFFYFLSLVYVIAAIVVAFKMRSWGRANRK